ncbi:MAG: two-component sensor histidine kinase [Lachnospiraceae bacterium]|nr:two-component sensor histidine kinase [Lachnospiraceae bacterium]
MKRTINAQIMLIVTIAIVLTSILCTLAYYKVFREEVIEDLKAYTNLLAETDFVNGDSSSEDNLESENSTSSENSLESGKSHYNLEKIQSYADNLSKAGIRVTIIESDGDVIFDNVADISELENHRDRAEIADAYEKGEGSSIRRSSTINRSNFYYAVRLDDGSILRTAKETSSIFNIFGHAFPLVVIFAFILIGVCYIISHFLTKSILKPIEDLSKDISSFPDKNEESTKQIYKELNPILLHIRDQHADIVKSSKIRQEFTANVSHELKTPLTSISGYSELIENGMATEEDTIKFAEEIHRNSDRLLVLINDILRLAELDTANEEELATQTVDLNIIAQTCQAMVEPSADKHGVTVTVEGSETLVKANKTMMEELIYNLCDNAIRYNKKGGHVWITTKDNTLTVEDDGIGISEKNQNRIFERFFRVDKSRSKKTGGTGLGLAIVKHIVEVHEATMNLESNEGKGTKITIEFPN